MELHRDEGDGHPVVLIHGFPDTAATWDTIADALVAEGHRVVVPHLRGYTPTSIVPGRPYDLRTLAEDAVGLLEDLDLPPATVVGHDWGAMLAYGAAALVPERVARVVGVAIPHPRTLRPGPVQALRTAIAARHFLALRLPWAAAQFRLADFSGVDVLYRRWAPGWTGPRREACIADVKAAFADPAVLDAALGYYRDLSPVPDRALLRRLSQPALVVGGDRDIVPASSFEGSRPAFTGPFRAVVHAGAGHWPHRQAEPQFIEDLVDFIATT